MSLKEKFFSEALMKETAKQKLGLVIKDGAINSDKIADGSVTTAKLADNAVNTSKLVDGSVTTVKIADYNITSEKLAERSITTTKIAELAVGSEEIAGSAITTDKIAQGAVILENMAEDSLSAKNHSFTSSQNIKATNVQDAIDEVKKELIDDTADIEAAITEHDTSIQNLSTELNNKANIDDVYIKTEVDTKVSAIDTKVDNKLNKVSDTATTLTVDNSSDDSGNETEALTVNGNITLNPSKAKGTGPILSISSGVNTESSGIEVSGTSVHPGHISVRGYLNIPSADAEITTTSENGSTSVTIANSGFKIYPIAYKSTDADKSMGYFLSNVTGAKLYIPEINNSHTIVIDNQLTNLQNTLTQSIATKADSDDVYSKTETDDKITALQNTVASQQNTIASQQATITSLQNVIYGITLGATADEVKAQYEDVKNLLESISTNITYNSEHTDTNVVGIYGTSASGDKIAIWQEDVTDQGGDVTGHVINYGYTADSSAPYFTLYSIDTEGNITVDNSVLSGDPKMYGAKLGGIIEG